jgi:hypothetical protein
MWGGGGAVTVSQGESMLLMSHNVNYPHRLFVVIKPLAARYRSDSRLIRAEPQPVVRWAMRVVVGPLI